MAGAVTAEDIAADYNFLTLASSNTSVETFTKALEESIVGYTQKRRLVDALKALLAKVEVVEGKLSVIKAVGKAKQLDDAEMHLVNTYAAYDIKEKVSAANASMQQHIEEGRITTEERPQVLMNLQARRDKAKAENKEKLLEKLERNIGLVSKVKPYELPVANLMDIHKLNRKIQEVEALEKRLPKSLSGAQRDSIDRKWKLEEDLTALHRKSRFWFETELEFRRRLDTALAELVKNEQELLRKEQEEAWEREREEERKAIEEKRLAMERKREEEAKKLAEKLEARRLEDQAKPQKAVPQAKKKEKPKSMKLNPHALFVAPSELRRQQEEEAEVQRELEGSDEPEYEDDDEEEEKPAPKASTNGYPSSAPAAVPVAPPVEEKPKPKPKPKAVKVVLENKWGDAPAAPALAGSGDEADGPSLAEAAKEAAVPKKEKEKKEKQPPPPPKKKEKAKFSKVSIADLGFDANNPNYR